MKRCRTGKTLLELMVVITLVSGALGLCAVTLTALFRTELQLRRDREQQFISARLAELWRADAHAAVACQAGEDCRFQLADGRTIRYAIDGPRVRREVTRGDKPEHRDSFAVPASAGVTLAIREQDDRELAVLTIRAQRSDRAYATPTRAATIEAIVNLHGQTPSVEAQP